MKKITNSSKSFYPSILKEHFITLILKSRYQANIIFKDLDNLALCIKGYRINMYTLNQIFKTILLVNPKLNFKISEIKTITQKNNYQCFLVSLSTIYRGNRWIVPITIYPSVKYFPNGHYEEVVFPKLKMKKIINTYRNEEILADYFYRIIKNVNVSSELLYDCYKMKSHISSKFLFKKNLINIYKSKKEDFDPIKIESKIKALKNIRILQTKWNDFKDKEKLKIEYKTIFKYLETLTSYLKEV